MLRREAAVLERPGQAATWSAELTVIGGGIVEAPWDEEVRRAPESGYLAAVPYPQAEQRQGVPYRSFYLRTAEGKYGRLQMEIDAGGKESIGRCRIIADMNPRPGSRNLEPSEEE